MTLSARLGGHPPGRAAVSTPAEDGVAEVAADNAAAVAPGTHLVVEPVVRAWRGFRGHLGNGTALTAEATIAVQPAHHPGPGRPAASRERKRDLGRAEEERRGASNHKPCDPCSRDERDPRRPDRSFRPAWAAGAAGSFRPRPSGETGDTGAATAARCSPATRTPTRPESSGRGPPGQPVLAEGLAHEPVALRSRRARRAKPWRRRRWWCECRRLDPGRWSRRPSGGGFGCRPAPGPRRGGGPGGAP